ncbi:hypothetical protein RhiirA1_533186 [Rhizophagus irregularis]|uniref:Uncharacterized protein n=1 Tax=Rhizophagus irregularis TaxID=588596 RepID=A0A2N0S2M0_9GLOM|nr:hypothetical protein RhiirA1_533186 [Rhizophagus irregularis]
MDAPEEILLRILKLEDHNNKLFVDTVSLSLLIIYIIKDNEKLLVEDEDDNSLSEDNNDENIENNLEIIESNIDNLFEILY